MNSTYLTIFGSTTFFNILNELDFNYILNSSSQSRHNQKKYQVKILFADNLNIKDVKNYLLKNEPTILILNKKDYIKKNNLNLLGFHVSLELPIDILSLKEILNILTTKYNFFKNSKIIIKDYVIDSNERCIIKQKTKVKLTEKELALILALNNNNGLSKSFLLKSIWKYSLDLDTHAFETHLHRLRKKIYKYFKEKNFIIEKESSYYLLTN
jgi:DNA-binding response OmpR family regulator